MIARLAGRVLYKAPGAVIVDVNGVGYDVSVPFSTFGGLPSEGEEVVLHIHTHLREDALSLFGFSSAAEKELFLLLTGVSGIGPKLALAILSNLSVEEVVNSLQAGDEGRLCRIPGIGKKTAGRLCLELADRIKRLGITEAPAGMQPQPEAGGLEDAVSALVNLGYRRQQAEDAVRKTYHHRPGAKTEQLIREALAGLMGQ